MSILLGEALSTNSLKEADPPRAAKPLLLARRDW